MQLILTNWLQKEWRTVEKPSWNVHSGRHLHSCQVSRIWPDAQVLGSRLTLSRSYLQISRILPVSINNYYKQAYFHARVDIYFSVHAMMSNHVTMPKRDHGIGNWWRV